MTFKSLLRVQIHLLRLGYLFEDLLDDNPVIVSDVTVEQMISFLIKRVL